MCSNVIVPLIRINAYCKGEIVLLETGGEIVQRGGWPGGKCPGETVHSPYCYQYTCIAFHGNFSFMTIF